VPPCFQEQETYTGADRAKRLGSALSLALILLAGLSAESGAQGKAARGKAVTCELKWTSPVSLRMPDGRPVYIEPGSIGQSGSKIITLGGPTFVWLSPTMFSPDPRDTAAMIKATLNSLWNLTRAGFVFDSTGYGSPIDPAPFGRQPIKPRLFRLDRDALGVLWAQDPDDTQKNELMLYARLKDGKWTDPVLLTDSVEDWQRNGGLTGITNTIPFYAVKDNSESRPQRFVIGFLDNGIWKKFRVPIDGLGPSLNIIPLQDAVVALVDHSGRDAGVWALRLRRSNSDTLAVEIKERLDSSAGSATREALLFRLSGDSVLAVWSHSRDGSYSLRSALSPDAGRRWNVLPAIPVSRKISNLGGTRSNNGDVHLVYKTNPPRTLGFPGPMSHVSFSNGRWTTPDAVTDHEVHAPVIGSTTTGVVVTWAEYETQWGSVVAPRTYASWLKACN
jgi:hypothetical protein